MYKQCVEIIKVLIGNKLLGISVRKINKILKLVREKVDVLKNCWSAYHLMAREEGLKAMEVIKYR